jgi:predicted ribosome quality control (RQC) complex YloA/Tae2 family protein
MKISLDIRKTVDENASSYFEQAKKERKKIEGTKKVISEHKEKLREALEKEELRKMDKPKESFVKRKAEWFEKFRWFISSDNILVIGGRDATTNEIVIKKHTDDEDVVFHTEMAGSPFIIIKRQGFIGDIPKATLDEAASFTAIFSRGWKSGLSGFEVFSVNPSQVSKQPNPGEYIQKGSFMIRGTKMIHRPTLNYAIGFYDEKIMGGPLSAVQKHCKNYVEIIQGDEKVSEMGKLIQKKIGGDLDDIIRVLPQNSKLKK